MIFDDFARAVERHMSQFGRTIFAHARLFHLPIRAHEVIHADAGTLAWMREHEEEFHLPFPCVAVEDTASLVFLYDANHLRFLQGTSDVSSRVEFPSADELADEAEFPATGLGASRGYTVVEPMTPEHLLETNLSVEDRIAKGGEARQLIDTIPGLRGAYFVTAGVVQAMRIGDEDGQWHGNVSVSWVNVVHPKRGQVVPNDACDTLAKRLGGGTALRDHARSVITALEEVGYVQAARDRFLVEARPLKDRPALESRGRRKKKRDHHARSHERPVYTLLSPARAREAMGLPQPKATGGPGGKRLPHERRAHLRTFRAARYKAARGKTIVVPSTWIGPRESVRGGKRYRVIVDDALVRASQKGEPQ